ncbi:MAG: DUF1311 domain-containing protein [Sphingobacteriia bacterium]|nr:DUF1311 domain-containing protein [Sphingobacteriia bacterium]
MMRVIFTLVLLLGVAPLAQAASFDCRKAATLVETTICQDVELSALDDALAEQYQMLMAAQIGDSARQSLKTTQRAWLKQRNRCQDRGCLFRAYRDRLDTLCQDYPVISGDHPGCVEVPTTTPVDASTSRAFSRCRLQIDGRDYIDGPCRGSLERDGSFMISAPAFFAIVSVDAPGVAQGYWNEEPHATHAHSPLGTLRRDGACWSNASARVCAWK